MLFSDVSGVIGQAQSWAEQQWTQRIVQVSVYAAILFFVLSSVDLIGIVDKQVTSMLGMKIGTDGTRALHALTFGLFLYIGIVFILDPFVKRVANGQVVEGQGTGFNKDDIVTLKDQPSDETESLSFGSNYTVGEHKDEKASGYEGGSKDWKYVYLVGFEQPFLADKFKLVQNQPIQTQMSGPPATTASSFSPGDKVMIKKEYRGDEFVEHFMGQVGIVSIVKEATRQLMIQFGKETFEDIDEKDVVKVNPRCWDGNKGDEMNKDVFCQIGKGCDGFNKTDEAEKGCCSELPQKWWSDDAAGRCECLRQKKDLDEARTEWTEGIVEATPTSLFSTLNLYAWNDGHQLDPFDTTCQTKKTVPNRPNFGTGTWVKLSDKFKDSPLKPPNAALYVGTVEAPSGRQLAAGGVKYFYIVNWSPKSNATDQMKSYIYEEEDLAFTNPQPWKKVAPKAKAVPKPKTVPKARAVPKAKTVPSPPNMARCSIDQLEALKCILAKTEEGTDEGRPVIICSDIKQLTPGAACSNNQ
jgi:hypothetical protein